MRVLILLAGIALLGSCGGARPAPARDAVPPGHVAGGAAGALVDSSLAPAYAAAAVREVQRSGAGRLGAATVCVSITRRGNRTEPDSAWLRELAFVGRRVIGMKGCVYRTWPITKDSTGEYVPTTDVPPPPGGEPDFLTFRVTPAPGGAVVDVSFSSGPFSESFQCVVVRGEASPSASCTRTGMSVA